MYDFRLWPVFFLLFAAVFSVPAYASTIGSIDMTATRAGYIALVIFVLAYTVVILEEKLHMRKSKPVLVAAGIIWALIGWFYVNEGMPGGAEHAFKATLLEFSELMLFLLVAMTYINTLEERRVFEALRSWMIHCGFDYRKLFWLTGFLAFFISPIADNLTTALLMCAVVLKVAEGDNKFINLCCINIVVAANAGGAFSPFGDITTLMVWQAGIIPFEDFFSLFVPSLVNFMVPALIMSFAIEDRKPGGDATHVKMKRGAKRFIFLFLLSIASAVGCHSLLHLPPVLGMMAGLGYLQFFGYYLRITLPGTIKKRRKLAELAGDKEELKYLGGVVPFDVFSRVARAEWDTLLFFYGVIMCVGGLGFMGYLGMMSDLLYNQWDATSANLALGVISAIVDNIPIMFAVLTMEPDMSQGQWLLITLTAGVGGSLLPVGSAAGVALMGHARGIYTFSGHLKWSPVIMLGYAASAWVHLWLNADMF
ncbi:MAG: sodium:proton antiporter NhaD [Motiliproteus sp.]